MQQQIKFVWPIIRYKIIDTGIGYVVSVENPWANGKELRTVDGGMCRTWEQSANQMRDFIDYAIAHPR